jgi:hypothetical protein
MTKTKSKQYAVAVALVVAIFPWSAGDARGDRIPGQAPMPDPDAAGAAMLATEIGELVCGLSSQDDSRLPAITMAIQVSETIATMFVGYQTTNACLDTDQCWEPPAGFSTGDDEIDEPLSALWKYVTKRRTRFVAAANTLRSTIDSRCGPLARHRIAAVIADATIVVDELASRPPDCSQTYTLPHLNFFGGLVCAGLPLKTLRAALKALSR